MFECKAYQREIDEAADGGRVSTGARVHASSCRACGDELRERERLRALVGGLGKVEAPADFEFRLRARMAASKVGRGHGRYAGARWLYGFAPVAVAVCFVIVSATLYFRQTARTTMDDARAVAAMPEKKVEAGRAPSIINEQRGPGDSTDAGGQVVQVNLNDVASSKSHKSVRVWNGRVRQPREVASRGERNEDVAQNTSIISVTRARVITPIPLKTSAEPLMVILRDERGAERVVPMRSVSFGSQDFLSRGAAPRPSAVAEVGGVW
jgi:hypothetical protein